MLFNVGPTVSPQEARHDEAHPSRVNLWDVKTGAIVTITTVSGSQYWVVVTNKRRPQPHGRIAGLSITTNSKTIKGFDRPPTLMMGSPVIEVGERWMFGRDGSTSMVTKISVS